MTAYTPYQLFVLTYLTQKESELQNNEQIFGQHAPGLTARFRIETTISELATIVTPSVIPSESEDPAEMMKIIEEQISAIRVCI
jgi:hypothetical protein